MFETVHLSARIPAAAAGRRLDQVLAELFSGYSRSRLQQWIKQGSVLLNGCPAPARYRVAGGEQVEIEAQLQVETGVQPQPIALDVRFEDPQLLVLNKMDLPGSRKMADRFKAALDRAQAAFDLAFRFAFVFFKQIK